MSTYKVVVKSLTKMLPKLPSQQQIKRGGSKGDKQG